MAETKEHLHIVKETIDAGLRLATTLETCRAIILDDDIEYELDCIGREIQATASALQQLHTVSHSASDKLPESERLDVFKNDGFQEIIELSDRCAKVYDTAVILISKAGTPGQKSKAPVDSTDGLKLTINIIQEGMRGRWLRPRLEKCLEQLKWLKMNILCLIQLGGLAKIQLKNAKERAPGSFEEELVMRGAALRLRQKAADELENLKPKNWKEDDDFMGIFGEELPLSDDEDIVPGKVEEIVEVIERPEITVKVPVVVVAPEESMFDKIGETFDTIKPEVKSPASVSSSDTFVVIEPEELEESEDIKTQGLANTRAGLFDDFSKPVATEEPTAVKIPQPVPKTIEAPSAAEPSQGAVKVALSEENGSTIPEADLPLAAKSQKKIKIIPTWLKNIFSRPEINPEDKESQTLEAFVLSEDLKDIVKIPFGHDCLTYGLKKMKKSSLTWDQYMSLSLEKRQSINRAVASAKRADARKRQCISVGYQKGSSENRMILFFSLGEPVEPVHLKDAVGRRFDFQYERCRTWKQMHTLICEAFKHVSVIGPHVLDAHYDLVRNTKGNIAKANGDLLLHGDILLPSQFEASIEPGLEISMHLWPMDDILISPPRIAPPPLHTGPPPPPPGGWGLPPGPPPRPRQTFPPPPPIIVFPSKKSQLLLGQYSLLITETGPPSSIADSMYADSDIEDGPEDKGIEIDYKQELEKSKLTMGELLARFTYALDTVDEQMTSIFAGIDDSDTSSSYSRSLVDD
ncbi:hypothetical protein B0J14DRAFT_564263 [Halenospora varia]|nr:hypothetical protein B0J14DRAFT_564263 [Halenospora varia]